MDNERAALLWWAVGFGILLLSVWASRALPNSRWFWRITRVYRARKAIAAALTSTCRYTAHREVITDKWHQDVLNFWVLGPSLSVAASGTYDWSESSEVINIRYFPSPEEPSVVLKYQCHRTHGIVVFNTTPLH